MELIRGKEVCDMLKINRRTLSKYVKEGSIRQIVLGNMSYRYDKEQILKFLNGGSENGSSVDL